MDNSELHDILVNLAINLKYLQSQIAILKRKRFSKRDPYYILYSVLLHLYCTRDIERFKQVFDQFVAGEMEDHFKENFDCWSYIEKIILLYADLLKDSQYNHLIPKKGLVKSRLEGSVLDLNRRNLNSELQESDRGHALPKETILRRYQSLISECILIIYFKKTGMFSSHKRTKAELERYCQLYLMAQKHFYDSDDQFIASLKEISDNWI